jgi:hypothetical protein
MDSGVYGGSCGDRPEFYFRSRKRKERNLHPQSGSARDCIRNDSFETSRASLADHIHFRLGGIRLNGRVRLESLPNPKSTIFLHVIESLSRGVNLIIVFAAREAR